MPTSLRQKTLVLVVVPFLLSAAGCGSSKHPPTKPAPTAPGTPLGSPVGNTIGPEGGTITSPDGRVSVRVPPGSLAKATTFTVQEITNTAPGGLGSSYRLGPEGTTFIRPVTFTFVAGWSGAPTDRLAVAFRDKDGYWNNAPSLTRNVGAKTLTVSATHFSDWAIVSADPTRDMAGAFTIQSSTDIPISTSGQATLTYAGQTSQERWYVLSGTNTLQQPVTDNGVACTPLAPAYSFPTNVADVLNTPDRFWWGTSGHWDLSCGGAAAVATMAFDTQGLNFLQCSRGYQPTAVSPTPIITLDRLQGAYTIDCGNSRTVSATWDFYRCGGTCTSSNVCHTAAISCASGVPVCTDTGNVANGTSCGDAAVCGDGTCNACTQNQACTIQGSCFAAAVQCGSGFPVCTSTTNPLAAGTSCGTNQVCNGSGQCNSCTAGVECTPPGACFKWFTDCSSGTSQCLQSTTPVAAGTACGSNQVCDGSGQCNTCVADSVCTPTTSNDCHQWLTSCSTGTQQCVEQLNTPLASGTSCGATPNTEYCNATGTCSACVEGITCAPSACTTGTTSCATGSQSCANVQNVANGTSCDPTNPDLVCKDGSCVACTSGLPCTPADPCHKGVTSCSTGTSVCMDTGTNADAGTSCGSGLVCDGLDHCVACNDGASCTPDNPCHEGKISCSSGGPVCVDQNVNLANGTSCATTGDQVCYEGTCGACTQGASCTLVNTCASATIECSSGLPVCTARTPPPDTSPLTACGTDLACMSGLCLPTTCQDGLACVPTNPCHTGAVTCSPAETCTDTTALPGGTALPDGTTCGTNLVCRTGTCYACPAAAGTACQPTNPCATAATITCSGSTATCTDTPGAFKPVGTACGTNLTCSVDGVCQ